MKSLLWIFSVACTVAVTFGFVLPKSTSPTTIVGASNTDHQESESRRNFVLGLGTAALAAGKLVPPAVAAVGSLPEFADTNAILQGLTVNVADPSQQKSMIEFLIQGFGFQVLRQRINGPIEETVRKYERIVFFFLGQTNHAYLLFSGWDLVPNSSPFQKHLQFRYPLLDNMEDTHPSVFAMIRRPNPLRTE